MFNILFFVKSLAIAIIITMLLQIHLGEDTLETHVDSWMRDTVAVELIDEAAQGGIKIIRDGLKKISASLNGKYWKQQKEQAREATLSISRSQKYIEEQAEKLKPQEQ